jgi:hypothetical protein
MTEYRTQTINNYRIQTKGHRLKTDYSLKKTDEKTPDSRLHSTDY